MSDEGKLEVRLATGGGGVASAQLTSTRRTDFSKLLVGLPVDAALALVPSLFSICGSAQAAAGLAACEEALGLEPDEGNRALRRALAALEALENHAFQFFVEWPRFCVSPPDAATFKAWRAACEAVRRGLLGGRPWAVPGGVSLEGAPAALGPLRALVEAFAPPAALADAGAAARWARGLASLRAAEDAGAWDLGRSAAPLVPVAEPRWFAERLALPGFGAQPTLEGRPAESGALALVAHLPLAEALLAGGGRTVFARWVARLLDVHRLLVLLEEAAPLAAGARARPLARREAGAGAGVADTSRGRLAHAVELRAGRVASWRTVAPTEWTFHPRGVLVEALQALTPAAALAAAPFLVSALDPCVACRVRVDG
jgi:coenzyme F420-reducing hydrogenase alpha subunit